METLRIDVKDVSSAGKRYEFPLSRAWLASVLEGSTIAPVGDRDGHASLFACSSDEGFVVTGPVKASVAAECVRCLEPAVSQVSVDVTGIFRQQDDGRPTTGAKTTQDDELSMEELETEPFQGDHFFVDGLVRDAIVLEVPMQPLCREDCPGIEIPDHMRGTGHF